VKIHRINPTKRWNDVAVLNGIASFAEVPETDASEGIRVRFRKFLIRLKK
jgi:hypothetical protein